jgi:uncharacterized protein
MSETISTVRLFAASAGLLLPTLTLLPLGALWIWQSGYLLAYLAFASLSTALAYAAYRGFAADVEHSHVDVRAVQGEGRELALSIVERRAESADPAALASWSSLMELGQATVQDVADVFHPGELNAPLKFSVPEFLVLIEETAARMRPIIVAKVPLANRLTVGQIYGLYEWRSIGTIAQRAWDLWRIVRLINPTAAATNEARERLVREVADWGKRTLLTKLLQIFVREIGVSAIDLYSGALKDKI